MNSIVKSGTNTILIGAFRMSFLQCQFICLERNLEWKLCTFFFLNFDKCAIFKIEHKQAQVSFKKKSCQHGGKQIWICELLLNFSFCNLWLLSSFWLLLLERQATGKIFLFACFLNRKIKAPFFENGTTFQHRFDLHSLSLFFALLYNGILSWLIDT